MEKTPQGGLRILFADDEAHLRELMQMELPRLGHEVTVCPDGTAAIRALEKGSYDVALLDLRMPGLTGIEVLGKIRQLSPETQVIILTGQATVDTAVQALRLGAFDYLTKPCKWAELEVILNRVAERRDLANKASAFETRLKAVEGTPLIVGESPSMQGVRRLIDTIAPTDAAVMILGETGTGKELVARNLHDKSKRAAHAFIPVNCGALPENLVESELFGHRKGAFTGRRRAPQGAVRGRQRRHALPRRGRRARQERAGEVAPVPRVGRDPTSRRERPVPRRRPHPLRDEPEPARHDRGRHVPRGPVLPAQHVRDPPSGPPRAEVGPPGAGPAHARALRGPSRRARADAHARGDRAPVRRTTGRATSASWPTPSSGP